MFDIGSGELVVIAVVALVAIGPKELPGVLRMVGQWTGKARRMAAEFQSQFQEALREAELSDLKKSFDDVKDVANSLRGGNLLASLSSAVGALDSPPPASPQSGTGAGAGATAPDASPPAAVVSAAPETLPGDAAAPATAAPPVNLLAGRGEPEPPSQPVPPP
ncbi:MAG: Sec-independent protein translocase protein TatB [Alphaproteobacteria bacterium]|nr:Sec-independent protein translocase protein TatB [Alphaproteobacteria bacterium]